jgi:hypothetical protein
MVEIKEIKIIAKELTPFIHRVYLQLIQFRPHQKQRNVTNKCLTEQRQNWKPKKMHVYFINITHCGR